MGKNLLLHYVVFEKSDPNIMDTYSNSTMPLHTHATTQSLSSQHLLVDVYIFSVCAFFVLHIFLLHQYFNSFEDCSLVYTSL